VLGRTYPSDEPATLIDHIFFYPREAWATRSVASGVALRPGDKTFSAAVRVASDHVPLTADLELLIGGAP
jgi:endonuclease/exonuclease/phosphatase family metal-dependent hydrolase